MQDSFGLFLFATVWVAILAIIIGESVSERHAAKPYANPYARLLGATVEAKVYEGSDWERMVVVAVSWKGALCVRPLRDLSMRGRWIHKSVVPHRVREVCK